MCRFWAIVQVAFGFLPTSIPVQVHVWSTHLGKFICVRGTTIQTKYTFGKLFEPLTKFIGIHADMELAMAERSKGGQRSA